MTAGSHGVPSLKLGCNVRFETNGTCFKNDMGILKRFKTHIL